VASGDNIKYALPLVESGQKYAPGTFAAEVQNLQLTPEGTLRGVRGPAPYVPDYGSGYPWPGRIYGVYNARLDRGMREVTLVRSGTKLMEVTGWTRGTRDLATGLSDEPNARYPDCFVEVAGKIVWCNGVDTPRIYDGYRLLPLGYDLRPGAPSATGPGDTGHPVFRNKNGYSHPGKIGLVGNFFSIQSGAVLDANWYYYVQFEDAFGNRSPLSGAGGPVKMRQEYTKDLYWVNYANYSADPSTNTVAGITLYPGTSLGLLTVTVDDLTKQFLVSGLAIGPAGTVARILYRTAANDPTPRELVRIDDNCSTVFPDNTPDSGLGAEAQDYIPTPTFGIAWEHNGCLYVVDGRNIRKSEPLYPGTFKRDAFTTLPAEPTGGFSFAGKCYATTETGIFRIEETAGASLTSAELPAGYGMVAPQSGDATGLGVYVGLGRDGFWSMDIEEAIRPLSEEIRTLFRRLNPGMLSRAFGRWNPDKREYVCALPEAGNFGNTLLKTWDGAGWRSQRHSIAYASLCVTKDPRRYMLAAGRQGSNNILYALDREVQSYTPPTKVYAYRSQWLRMDATGRDRFDVTAIYVGIVEAVKGANITWQTWKNGSRDTPANSAPAGQRVFDMANEATVNDVAVTDAFDALVLGTGRARHPRLTWKRFDVRLFSVESFAFDLTSSAPMHIAAFSFDCTLADATGARTSRA
jgi:hypothetical protein